MKALMIKRNKPKVKIVTGSVSITSIGLTINLSNASIIATIIAVTKPSTATPGSSFESTTTATAVSKILIIDFIRLNFKGYAFAKA